MRLVLLVLGATTVINGLEYLHYRLFPNYQDEVNQ